MALEQVRYSVESFSPYFIKILFINFILAFIGIVIYQLVMYVKRQKDDSPILVEKPISAKTPLVIPASKMVKPDLGTNISFSFWMYINEWDYNYDRPKHIFHVGDANMTQICPGLWLYPRDNNLMVRTDTYEDPSQRKAKYYIADQKKIKGCPSANYQNIDDCKNNCDADSGCTGYSIFSGSAIKNNTICSTFKGKNFDVPDAIGDTDTNTTSYIKTTTRNPAFDQDPSDFNVKKQCDIANIPIQRWIFVAVVLRENSINVYLNGNLARSCRLANMPKLNGGDLHIALDGGFDGLITMLRYHRFALNDQQVEELYILPTDLDPSLAFSKIDADFNKYVPVCRVGNDIRSPNSVRPVSQVLSSST